MIYGFSLVDDCNPMMADCDTNNIHFWEPLEYSREISFILMPLSIILLVAFLVESNIKRILYHPWLFAIIIWSFCHLISSSPEKHIFQHLWLKLRQWLHGALGLVVSCRFFLVFVSYDNLWFHREAFATLSPCLRRLRAGRRGKVVNE